MSDEVKEVQEEEVPAVTEEVLPDQMPEGECPEMPADGERPPMPPEGGDFPGEMPEMPEMPQETPAEAEAAETETC